MKLIEKIKKAPRQKKELIWRAADLMPEQSREVVEQMILTLPPGYYSLRAGGLFTAINESYGWEPALHIDERMIRGLGATHPDKIYVNLTLGLDEVGINN